MQYALRNSRILITGGAGFIGSNLVGYFLARGNEVVCLDNLSTGHKHNIAPYLDHPNFRFIEGDIRNLEDCRRAVRGCAYVFHQAALGSVPRSIRDPLATNSVNIDGFINMLTAARDEGVRRFVFATSSSVYGDNTDLPKREHRTGHPMSPYAVTKIVNEHYARVFSQLYGMETIGLRYFNVFGENQDPNGAYAAVIPRWIRLFLEGKRPVVYGDGSQSRDFTYVENIFAANELAAVLPKEELLERLAQYPHSQSRNGALHEVFNIAYGGRVTVLELFYLLREILAGYDPSIASIEPVFHPPRPGEIQHSNASIEKAVKVLGYKPVVSLKSGLARIAKWYYRKLQGSER